MIGADKTIADVVTEHASCAAIFSRHGIDFCCKGQRSIRDAAEAAGVDLESLLRELEAASAQPSDEAIDPQQRSTASLIAHIIGRYHDRLRESLPFVRSLAAKVAAVHGEREPGLRTLDALVAELADALLPHIDDEEQRLFPRLMTKEPPSEERERMLREMEGEHLDVGRVLASMREVTGGYAPGEGACRSYRTLYASLAELEGDIFRHVHLENHVLAPRFSERAS